MHEEIEEMFNGMQAHDETVKISRPSFDYDYRSYEDDDIWRDWDVSSGDLLPTTRFFSTNR